MNMNDYNNAINYCNIRCSQSYCSKCRFELDPCCRVCFISELFDIINFKTLEQNNLRQILDELDTVFENKKYEKEEVLIREISKVSYCILTLFVDDQYKLTKKKDYIETLNSICKKDE